MTEALQHIVGLYYGQLTAEEVALYEQGYAAGLVWLCYNGVAGFLGLAKIAWR